MQNPALNPAILLTPAEDSYVAYDPTTDRLHTLNPIGALITELCDGSRSVDQIRQIVAPLLPQGQSAEIDRCIQQGVEAGLFIYNGNSGSAHRELTAKELFDLAHRLQSGGKLQTALICERRVTELAPDNPSGWYYLGELTELMGRRDETLAAYEKYSQLQPDNEEIRHILVALRGEAPPARMSDKCVVQIYDGFASSYESRVLEDLGYKGPQRIRELVAPLLAGRPPLAVLDLGCGSGLAGVKFKPFASRMVGIDLSPEMVALARARNLYDRLDVAEITAWLDANPDRYDLVVGCDCFIYFGDLQPVASGVAKLLTPGGIFAFTLERGQGYPYKLNDAGRYEHHPDYVREVAARAALDVARMEEGFLRTEYGKDVTGLFTALAKPS